MFTPCIRWSLCVLLHLVSHLTFQQTLLGIFNLLYVGCVHVYFPSSNHYPNSCVGQISRMAASDTCSSLACVFFAADLKNASGPLLIPLCLEFNQAYICDHHCNYQTEFWNIFFLFREALGGWVSGINSNSLWVEMEALRPLFGTWAGPRASLCLEIVHKWSEKHLRKEEAKWWTRMSQIQRQCFISISLFDSYNRRVGIVTNTFHLIGRKIEGLKRCCDLFKVRCPVSSRCKAISLVCMPPVPVFPPPCLSYLIQYRINVYIKCNNWLYW